MATAAQHLRAILTIVPIVALSPGYLSSSRPLQGPNKFTTSGSPSVGDIDAKVEAIMKANDVHNASLAIVMGPRLVYAKGYTYGPPGTPTAEPTTLFRQASCSKFITALAIMQLIEEGKLTRETRMQDVLQLKTHDGKPPVDPGFDKITVQDLLEMRSGLNDDSPFSDVKVSSATGKALPVGVKQVEEYAAGENLVHKPGERSKAFYSNADYSFLGYIVAKQRGAANLIDAIRPTLLEPLGIKRIRASRSLKRNQLPDEAVYYSNPYATAPSVMTPAQPQVELEYGDENIQNFEGAGGLSAAATDYARILAALNLADNDVIFKKSTTYPQMLGWSSDCYKDKRFASDAFGFYGLDSCEPIPGEPGRFEADKGGLLETSQNGIYFQSGGLAYVICWDGLTPKGESWYPVFTPIVDAALDNNWGNTDLFPKYGMPAFMSSLPGPVRIRVPKVFARPVSRLRHVLH